MPIESSLVTAESRFPDENGESRQCVEKVRRIFGEEAAVLLQENITAEEDLVDSYVQEKMYEAALRRYKELNKQSPELWGHLLERVIETALSDEDASDEDSYPSLKGNQTVRAKYKTDTSDSRFHYKFDLIADAGLSPEKLDPIIERTVTKLIDRLEAELNLGHGYRSTSDRRLLDEVLDLSRSIRLTLRKLPVSQEAFTNLRAQFLGLLPRIIGLDQEGFSQDAWLTFRVTKAEFYAAALEARNQIFHSSPRSFHSYNFDKISVLVELQKRYKLPITPDVTTQSESLLRFFILNQKNATVLQETFTIPEARVRAIAVEEISRLLQERVTQKEELREGFERYGDPQAFYVKEVMERYGISVDEIPVLQERSGQLLQAAVVHEEDRKAAIGKVERSLQSDLLGDFLPDVAIDAFEKSFHIDDRQALASLRLFLKENKSDPVWASENFTLFPHYQRCLKRIFAEAPLDSPRKRLLRFEHPEDQDLWKELFSQQETVKMANRELKEFLKDHSLDSAQATCAWARASNTTPRWHEDPKQVEEMLPKNVAMRNVQSIVELDKVKTGTASYFQKKWNINSFCRYPTDVLVAIHDRKVNPDKNILSKGNVLYLNAVNDWNGAFERHDLTRNIFDEAEKCGYEMHIAEAATRTGALRALARSNKEGGPLDYIIAGVHSDGKKLYFGGNAEDQGIFSAADFQVPVLSVDQQSLTAKEKKRIRARKEKRVRKVGHFFLNACSTGTEGGIIDNMSNSGVGSTGPIRPGSLETIDMTQGRAFYRNSPHRTLAGVRPPLTRIQRLLKFLRQS